jgi:hypothetical protein
MKKHWSDRGDRGLIKIIILLVIALLVLSYFNINLRALVNAPTTQDNISYVASNTELIWNSYLKGPATYLWNDIFINLIWNPAISNLTNMKNGNPSNINTLSSSSTWPLPVSGN